MSGCDQSRLHQISGEESLERVPDHDEGEAGGEELFSLLSVQWRTELPVEAVNWTGLTSLDIVETEEMCGPGAGADLQVLTSIFMK